MRITQDSVGVKAFSTFIAQEKEDLKNASQKWKSELEKLPKNEREKGLDLLAKYTLAVSFEIDNLSFKNSDLVQIRQYTKGAINEIDMMMRQLFSSKVESSWMDSLACLTFPHMHTTERQNRDSRYGVNLSDELNGLDKVDLQYARISGQSEVQPLKTRVYHCAMSIGHCVKIENPEKALPELTQQELLKNNSTACEYLTHEKNERGFLEPVDALVVGTTDPDVCKPLFLDAGFEVKRDLKEEHRAVMEMYKYNILF